MKTDSIRYLLAPALLLAAVALGGCTQMTKDRHHWEEASEQVSRVDKHSSFPAVRRANFETINLIELIDPHGEAKKTFHKTWHENDVGANSYGVKYDLVLAHFRQDKNKSAEEKRLHRNSVQDRMLSVSTSRCNVFKTYLRRSQSDSNFYLGSATTAAGVLGAVLPGVTASRNLAGAAGLFSGIQAEYNADYYSNLAAHVIVQGIELAQNRLQTKMVEDREKLSIDQYSMEAAIKDAIHFDGTCSTVAGLIEASESIKETTNPGLPRAAEIISAVRAMREISETPNFSDMMDSGRLQQLLKRATPATPPLIASAIRPGYGDPDLQSRLVVASQATQRINDAVAVQAAELGRFYAAAQAKLPADERNKTVTVSLVATTFESTVSAFITSTVAATVTQCVNALAAPTRAFGQANSAHLISQEGSDARITAEQDLAIAKANAAGAAARVELLVSLIKANINDSAKRWEKKLEAKNVSEKDIGDLGADPWPATVTGFQCRKS